MNKIIILCGPSGAGKSSLAKSLCKDKCFGYAISCTTRQKRQQEIDGVDYIFLNKKQFLQKIEQEQFVEFTLFEGEYYGTLKQSVENILLTKNCVIIIDPFSIKSVLAKSFFNQKQVISIFLDVDDKTLINRLRGRGESDEIISNKIIRTQKERQSRKFCQYVLNNYDLNVTIKEIKKILLENDF